MLEGESPIKSPFKHIALSLSGGGVRAVGYHLGTLDYLDRIGLLKEVHTLSSVSGGSLVAMGYALSLKKGESFQQFYDNICNFLPEVNTFEELLKILKDPAPNVASGSTTLITALATVYREKYFGKFYDDPAFGCLWEDKKEIHLKEIVFNATEFKTGMGFRFQAGVNGSLIGNSKISIPESLAKDIRMSDIMAASSCIPGGMEPLKFPQDFHWPGDPALLSTSANIEDRTGCNAVVDYLKETYEIDNIPLMDGGIYDNQGITSVILTQAKIFKDNSTVQQSEEVCEFTGDEIEPQAPKHWAKWLLGSMEKASEIENQKDLGDVDLFIVSDTPIHSDPMYSIPETEDETGLKGFFSKMRLRTIDLIGWIATIALMLSVLVSASFIGSANDFIDALGGNLNLPQSSDAWGRILVYTYFAVLLIQIVVVSLAAYLMYRFRKFVSHSLNKVVSVMPPMQNSVWSYAKNLTIGQLVNMASQRASSMSALTAKIFMHRVRQMGYSLLYSHDEFGQRILDNNINDTLHAEQNINIPSFARDPSDAAERVTKIAATMETKLWINEPECEGARDDLDYLIAAGHISTCFNIIEFLWEWHRDQDGNLAPEMQPLFDRVKSDWLHLNEDPFWLLDIREGEGTERGQLFWNKKQS